MDKPDALRLADELDEPEYLMHKQAAEAAAELRRLHAVNQELLEACKALEILFAPLARDSTTASWIDNARAAIAKAEEQK